MSRCLGSICVYTLFVVICFILLLFHSPGGGKGIEAHSGDFPIRFFLDMYGSTLAYFHPVLNLVPTSILITLLGETEKV